MNEQSQQSSSVAGLVLSSTLNAELLRTLNLSNAPRILGRVRGFALKYRWRFVLATVASLLATLFNLAIPRRGL
jgi:hypothetical protein